MADAQPTVIRPGPDNPHLRGTYALEQAAADALNITDDVGPLASLLTFDIRNGPVATAKPLLVKPTIGRAWHWRPIAELPPGMSVKHVNAFVRTYRCAVEGLPAERYPAPLKRKVAIVLGVARAVCTELYNIETPDLIPGESGQPYLKACMTAQGEVRFTIVGNPTAAQQACLTGALEFSDEEKAVISSIHMSAIGVLPVQGYSLIMTNHHYLPDTKTQSFKAFQVMERQHWTSTAVKPWWDANLDVLRDVLFHKVGHPVLINVKQALARNPQIVDKLKTAGCGSAAARLPAVESEVRAANSYRMLCQTVRTLFEAYGGYLNFVVLDQAIECVNRCTPGVENPIADGEQPSTVPVWVRNRETALSYLKQVIDGHMDIVAYCYGFYVALSDANQTSTGVVTDDTLRTSYSLTKLAKQSTASYNAGRVAHGDYAEGKYTPPVFTFVGGRSLPEGTVPQGVGGRSLPEGTVPQGVGVQGLAPLYEPR